MNQPNCTKLSFKGQHFFIGLDVQKINWKVTIRFNKTGIRRPVEQIDIILVL